MVEFSNTQLEFRNTFNGKGQKVMKKGGSLRASFLLGGFSPILSGLIQHR